MGFVLHDQRAIGMIRDAFRDKRARSVLKQPSMIGLVRLDAKSAPAETFVEEVRVAKRFIVVGTAVDIETLPTMQGERCKVVAPHEEILTVLRCRTLLPSQILP